MRVGVDCRKIYDYQNNRGAGIERYVYHLARQLPSLAPQHEFVFFFHSAIGSETLRRVKANFANAHIVKLPSSAAPWPLWENHWLASRALRAAKLDWCLFPSGSRPLFYAGRSLLICHDLAIYLRPDWFPEKQWWSTKVVVPRSLRSATQVVAVSQNTKEDLQKIFNLTAEKIAVVSPGVATKSDYSTEETWSVQRKFGLAPEFFLFLGTVEPRKNLLTLLRAFANFVFSRDSRADLVIAGDKGWKYQDFFQTLAEINSRLPRPQIKYLGRVSNRERNILLRTARALVYPSFYEGFGLPVAEAMALGTPVITSNNSSLKELGAAGRALLVEAADSRSLEAALARLSAETDLRIDLIKKSRDFVTQLTWENAARKILALLEING